LPLPKKRRAIIRRMRKEALPKRSLIKEENHERRADRGSTSKKRGNKQQRKKVRSRKEREPRIARSEGKRRIHIEREGKGLRKKKD